jgi:hypothetical protein
VTGTPKDPDPSYRVVRGGIHEPPVSIFGLVRPAGLTDHVGSGLALLRGLLARYLTGILREKLSSFKLPLRFEGYHLSNIG